jgi:hypothetical protein
MKLTEQEMEFLQDFADNMCFTISKEYSGRSMYGNPCFGLVIDSNYSDATKAFGTLIYELMNSSDSNLIRFAERLIYSNISQDNLGYDTILYFPRFEWNEEIDSEFDEE